MTRSFRLQLTGRFTLSVAVGVVAMAALTYAAIRETLDQQINASLANVASIQAAAITEPASGEMRIREWEITPEEAAAISDINRYAQVWSSDGESLLRTRHLTDDLPLDLAALGEASEGEIAWTEQEFQGAPIRSLYYPLGRLGRIHDPHVLQVSAPLSARNATLHNVGLLLLGIILVVSLGALVGSWWLAGRAVQPVTEIIDQAEEIGAGTIGRRISAWAESREYQRLVQVLNGMLGRLDAAFESQRRFTADASHELRSPLTALRGELELATRRDRDPEEYRRVIASALEEVERLSRTAEDLLTLARSDAGVIQPHLRSMDLSDSARRIVEAFRAVAEMKGVELVLAARRAFVLADPDLVDRMLRNLVENAIKFTPPGGRVAVSSASEDRAGVLEVTDTGPGIPEEDLERIFERFHRVGSSRTPDRGGGGTGLGLAIARTIAELLGGQLSVKNREAGGTRFFARFPPAVS